MSRGYLYGDPRAEVERTTTRRTPPGLADAIRRLDGRPGPATEDDRPPVSTLPGKQPREIVGQRTLDDRRTFSLALELRRAFP